MTLLAPPLSLEAANIPAEVSFQPFVLDLPSELGRVKVSDDRENCPSGKCSLLVHIEDAHGVPQAQRSIQKILELLKERRDYGLLLLEGASGVLKPERFHFFNEDERDQKVWDKLYQQSVLSGADLFLLQHSREVRGYGVENRTLYRQNVKQLKELFLEESSAEKSIQTLYQLADAAASKVLDQETYHFSKDWWNFQTGQRDLFLFVSEVLRLSRRNLHVRFRSYSEKQAWPYLARLEVLKKMEKHLDRKKIEDEKRVFLREMKELNFPEELIRDVETIEKQDQPREIFERFFDALRPRVFSFSRFPHFILWVRYLILSREMNSPAFYEEIEKMSRDLLKNGTASEPQKKIVLFFRELSLLRKMLRLELTRKEWKRIKEKAPLPSSLRGTLQEISGQQVLTGEGYQELEHLYEQALHFYQTAEKRDQVLLEKSLHQMTVQRQTNAVLITGGFHSQGLRSLCREKGIRYIRITPAIPGGVEGNPYAQRMLQTVKKKETVQPSSNVAIPDALQDRGYLETLGEWDYIETQIKRAVAEVGIAETAASLGDGSEEEDETAFAEIKLSAQLGYDLHVAPQKRLTRVLKRWVRLFDPFGLELSVHGPEGEFIAVNADEAYVGMGPEAGRKLKIILKGKLEDEALETFARQVRTILEDPEFGTYEGNEEIEEETDGEIVQLASDLGLETEEGSSLGQEGKPSASSQGQEPKFRDLNIYFYNGLGSVTTFGSDEELVIRVRTPESLRERLKTLAIETDLPGQQGKTFERDPSEDRDGYDAWKLVVPTATTGGYFYMPYAEMEIDGKVKRVWAGEEGENAIVRIFPRWATEGLNSDIAFIKNLRRPGTAQKRFGNFTDFNWYLEEMSRMGMNSTLLLPFTDPFGNSPYEAYSPFAIDPRHIDWEKAAYPGETAEEKFEAFKKQAARDSEFQAFIQAPLFQEIQNYADLKALYTLNAREGGDFNSELLRKHERYAYYAGAKDQTGYFVFEQYMALKQMKESLALAHKLGIKLFFDMPFFQSDRGSYAVHHPEYFSRSGSGQILAPVYDKGDPRDKQEWKGQGLWDYDRIAGLNHEPITQIFGYWLDQGFDGFRWDAAHMSRHDVHRAMNLQLLRGRDALPIAEQLGGWQQDTMSLLKNGFLLYLMPESDVRYGGHEGLVGVLKGTRDDYFFSVSSTHDTPRMPFIYKSILGDSVVGGKQEEIVMKALHRQFAFSQTNYVILQGDERGHGGRELNDMRINEPGNANEDWDVPSPGNPEAARYDLRPAIAKFMEIRKEHPVLRKPKTLEFFGNNKWGKVSSFVRASEKESVLVINNLTAEHQDGEIKLPLERFHFPNGPFILTNLETGEKIKFVPRQNFIPEEKILRFDLDPGEAYIFDLNELKEAQPRNAFEEPAYVFAQDPFYRRLLRGMEEFIAFDASGRAALYAGGRGTHFGDQEWGRDFAITALGLAKMAGMRQWMSFPEGVRSSRRITHQLIRRWAGIDDKGRKRIDGKSQDGHIMYNVINWYGSDNKNTADAPLWFVETVYQYLKETSDYSFLDEEVRPGQTLLQVLWEIIERYSYSLKDLSDHRMPARSIQMDPATGLILVPHEKYTWMDTEFTQRQGYPVEIQALWYNALRRFAELADKTAPDRAREATFLAKKVKKHFLQYFWNEQAGHLNDILGTDGVMRPDESVRKGWKDAASRPNQIFAVWFGLVEGEKAKLVLRNVKNKLLIPGALRSLAPEKTPFAVYRPDFEVAEKQGLNKNAAYHNGLGWVWLYPFYYLAAVKEKVMTAEEAIFQMKKDLGPIMDHNRRGSLPELLSGDAYNGIYAQRGPDAQAWSVAAALFAFYELSSEGSSMGAVYHGNEKMIEGALREHLLSRDFDWLTQTHKFQEVARLINEILLKMDPSRLEEEVYLKQELTAGFESKNLFSDAPGDLQKDQFVDDVARALRLSRILYSGPPHLPIVTYRKDLHPQQMKEMNQLLYQIANEDPEGNIVRARRLSETDIDLETDGTVKKIYGDGGKLLAALFIHATEREIRYSFFESQTAKRRDIFHWKIGTTTVIGMAENWRLSFDGKEILWRRNKQKDEWFAIDTTGHARPVKVKGVGSSLGEERKGLAETGIVLPQDHPTMLYMAAHDDMQTVLFLLQSLRNKGIQIKEFHLTDPWYQPSYGEEKKFDHYAVPRDEADLLDRLEHELKSNKPAGWYSEHIPSGRILNREEVIEKKFDPSGTRVELEIDFFGHGPEKVDLIVAAEDGRTFGGEKLGKDGKVGFAIFKFPGFSAFLARDYAFYSNNIYSVAKDGFFYVLKADVPLKFLPPHLIGLEPVPTDFELTPGQKVDTNSLADNNFGALFKKTEELPKKEIENLMRIDRVLAQIFQSAAYYTKHNYSYKTPNGVFSWGDAEKSFLGLSESMRSRLLADLEDLREKESDEFSKELFGKVIADLRLSLAETGQQGSSLGGELSLVLPSFPEGLTAEISAFHPGISFFADVNTVRRVVHFLRPDYPEAAGRRYAEILDAMSFESSERSPEAAVTRFNQDALAFLPAIYQRAGIPDTETGSDRQSTALVLDLRVLKQASEAQVKRFADSFEKGDLLLALWNGTGQTAWSQKKPRVLSALIKHLIPRGVRVKDLSSLSPSDKEIKDRGIAQFEKGLVISSAGKTSLDALLPKNYEHFRFEMEAFRKAKVDPVQAAALLKQIAETADPLLRKHLYEAIGATQDGGTAIWTIGRGLVEFIRAVAAEDEGRKTLARAA